MRKPSARSLLTRRENGKTIQMTLEIRLCRLTQQGKKRKPRGKFGISNKNLSRKEKN